MATLTSGAYPIASKTSNRGFKSVFGLKEHPLAQAALMAICRNGGSAWWVPDSLTNSGIYTDSTGVTPVSAVGDVLGLLTDRSYGAGNLGPELVTNGGNPFTSTIGWTAFNAKGTMSLVGGRLRNTATAQYDSGLQTTLSASVGAGKRLAVTLDVYQSTAGRGLSCFSGSELSYTAAMPSGYSRITFIAPQGSTTATFWVRFAGGVEQVGDYFEIASISVREVLGNHATQATTASKPVVTRVPKRTRGPVNRLLWSGDLSHITWATQGGGSATSNTFTFAASASSQRAQVINTGAVAVTVAALVSTSSGTKTFRLKVWDGSIDRYSDNFTATTTPTLVVFPTTGGTGNASIANGTSADAGTVVVGGMGLFIGTYTAQQILDNGGIPLTTTEPLPNVLEWSNAIKFDGSNDNLSLSTVPFQMNQDHYAICSFSYSTAKNQTAFAPCGIAGNARFASIGTTPSGNLIVEWYDGTTYINHQYPLPANTPAVVSAVRSGGRCRTYLNGVLVSDSAAYSTAVAAGSAALGSGGLGPLEGNLIDAVCGQSTLTDADRKTIERNMAQRAGVTYLG